MQQAYHDMQLFEMPRPMYFMESDKQGLCYNGVSASYNQQQVCTINLVLTGAALHPRDVHWTEW